MKLLAIFLCMVLLMNPEPCYAQNLVPNPSFEDVSDCPNDFYQIYKSPPWYSPNCDPLRPDRHGYGILFTSKAPCASDLTGVPKNVLCNEKAHSGVSYAGVIGVSAHSIKMEYRQYVGTQLLSPLVAGRRYLFSMNYYLCDGVRYGPEIICFKNDSLGAYFSENRIDKNPNCQVLPFRPQVHGAGEHLLPSPAWRELVGGFTATGNEQFLLIGNFADNAFSNCEPNDSLGYYLFIDDVALVPEMTRQIDTILCQVNDWKLDAQLLRPEYSTLRGWTYQWSDGNSDAVRKFANAGAYILKARNNDFEDTYHFNIGMINCSCEEYIPNVFTPNGDHLNDLFIPHINCQNQQLSGYRFSIFNRWGTRIFFTTSSTQSWDGTYGDKTVPNGDYIYLVEYETGPANEKKTIKGRVLVLR